MTKGQLVMVREDYKHFGEGDLTAIEMGGLLWIIDDIGSTVVWCRSLADSKVTHTWYKHEIAER